MHRKLFSLLMLMTPFLAQGQDLRLLVGTYTENTPARGVYLYTFNTQTAATQLISEAPSGNPSFVITTPDGRYAYAVNEYNDGKQGVSSFVLDSQDGGTILRPLNFQLLPSGGEDPCNILYTGEALVTSNYTGGTVSAFPLNENGSIRGMSQFHLPHTEGSHMHCAVLSPDGKYIFVTNLGLDCIHRFDFNGGAQPLGEESIAWKNASAEKFGPRHMVFSADGRFAYLLCELGDKLVVFSYRNGKLTPIQTLTAYDGQGHGSADIHLSPDGRFLYTSHRLKDDGISIFSVNPQSGKVQKVGFQATGRHPRNFALSPDGRFLLCACRDDNRIEIYAVNTDTGALTLLPDATLSVGTPVCVQFVP